MSYKTIAIVISDEVGDKEALQAAVTLANREGGHLDVYCLGIDPVRYDMAPMGASPALRCPSVEQLSERKDATAWGFDSSETELVPS